MPLHRSIFIDPNTTSWEYVDFFQDFMGWDVFVQEPENADFVLFSGGPDVNPNKYGERVRHWATRGSNKRDKTDLELLQMAVLEGKQCIGICRGAQFLHVMNGGKLWQNVTGHGRVHSLRYKDKNYMVSSTHHQMMRGHHDIEGCEVVAQAEVRAERCVAEYLNDAGDAWVSTEDFPQLEIVTHTQPDDGAIHLCFQPHPEFVVFDADATDTFDLFKDVVEDTYNFSDKRG